MSGDFKQNVANAKAEIYQHFLAQADSKKEDNVYPKPDTKALIRY